MVSRLPLALLVGAVTLGHTWMLAGSPAASGDRTGRQGPEATARATAITVRVTAAHVAAETAQAPGLPSVQETLETDGHRRATGPVLPTPAPPEQGPHYWPAEQLTWPALPRSAPDTALLDGQALSGLPLRLRLYIDATGRVQRVEALQIAMQDRPALSALQAMFLNTAYSPGRLHNHDVASYTDLVLGVEAVVNAQDHTPDNLTGNAAVHIAAR